jgi:hypothetical protein
MKLTFTLLGISGVTGFLQGLQRSLVVLVLLGLVLAIVAAVLLQKAGVGTLTGITVIVTCLIVNELCFLVGKYLIRHTI